MSPSVVSSCSGVKWDHVLSTTSDVVRLSLSPYHTQRYVLQHEHPRDEHAFPCVFHRILVSAVTWF